DRIVALPRDDRWSTFARDGLRSDLYSEHAHLTAVILGSNQRRSPAATSLERWLATNRSAVDRYRQVLAEIEAVGRSDLAALLVAVQELRVLGLMSRR